ncbi:DUF7845 domain-containing protein [Halapricum hydrolyticum]|uniref:DUF7845 domain-containing protein n=1 Tax=Halapricum hydrolyticum TaxID=2979991 RepID=A0AAE3LDT4_9EURY|nr:hypothetical protein [Halapricum hydrolyticum]MCU4716814.1 hypothetical protein [Halapricum hydrolyticum]MCU4725581.1 hypothetical protein [Halapricum hydrolyticum]
MSQHPVALETHGLGLKLLFDEHGLSPYWGVVSVFEPDQADYLEPFDAIGETWDVVKSNQWKGQIAPPEDQDFEHGMYEYSYTVEALDEIGDKDAVIQFRPGFPNTKNVNSDEDMQALPDDLPESVRVQLITTNLEPSEARELLVAFAEHIGLNREYFTGEPHEFSRAYQIERYVRLARQASEDRIVGAGGILDQLADVASDQRGRGAYKWDHEEIVGHYQSVATDPDTWAMLLPDRDGREHGKRIKNYHPANPRGEASGDPLSHPKLEVALSNEYDPEGAVPIDALQDVLKELDETLYNVVHWAGLPLGPDAGVWISTDPYFGVEPADVEPSLRENPLPELRDEIEKHAETELIRTELSPTQEELLTVLTDGGAMHYEELADEAESGTSTVYRLVDKLRSLLRTDDGIVDFADNVTRDHVRSIVDKVRETADWATQSIRQVAEEHDLLRRDDGPLTEWLRRHGVQVIKQRPELELEISKPLSDTEIRQILRAGLDAAERSSLLTRRFENATITWRDTDGNEYPDRRVVVGGKILGKGHYRALR